MWVPFVAIVFKGGNLLNKEITKYDWKQIFKYNEFFNEMKYKKSNIAINK